MILKSLVAIILLYGIFYFLFLQKNVRFIVINSSAETFDSVLIRSHKLEQVFLNVKPGDSLSRRTAFNCSPGNGEGGFSVSIYKNGSLQYGNVFGFFMNASIVKENYKITILENRSAKILAYP